jgi:uncharacterized phage protein (TIGR02218 family)
MIAVELYEFTRDTEVWHKTSGGEAVEYGGNTYAPATIGRGDLEQKNEISKSNLEVQVDIFDDLAQSLLAMFMERVMTLTLYRQLDGVTGVAWKGRLTEVRPSKTMLTLVFENVFTSLRRPGLRARYQKQCRHVLYGTACGVDKDAYAVEGAVLNVVGNIVTIDEAALQEDGYYAGGVLKANNGILGFIVKHVGNTLTLNHKIESMIDDFDNSGYGLNYGNFYGGVKATLYPGCDKLRQTCENKFSNLDNFGGFPWIPSENPLDGSSIA